MQRYISMIMVFAMLISAGSLFAAATEEATGTTSTLNAATFKFDQAPVFADVTMTNAGLDAGYLTVDATTDAVVSANAAYKIQAKINTAPTLTTSLSLDNGSNFTAMTTSYQDVAGATGSAGQDTTHQTQLKVAANWTSTVVASAEARTITVKILTSG